MYEHYTRPSVDDIFAGKTSKYALAIAVAKRAREITDDLFAEKEKGGKGSDKPLKTCDKPVLVAIKEFEDHQYAILDPDTSDCRFFSGRRSG